ncbi:pyridoxal-dependent decarboxylase [Streptomyces sp. NPDC046557]|uniref:pyridoxal-dependent decarboxylase n=1 Tax=Streptomyces sp. NPDC046557 TaxID=3155372 RepID=UPI0033CD103C
MSPEEFRAHAHQVVDWVADYWAKVADLPVQARTVPGQVRAALPAVAPDRSEDFASVLRDVDEVLMPGLTHWQHPSFFGWFPANTSGPSVLGDILAAGLNVQGMMWSTSPACTELETLVCDWLVDLLALPQAWRGGGVLQDTATSAMLMATTASLSRAGGEEWRSGGVTGRYVCYASDQSNIMVRRVCRVTGIGDDRLRLIPTDPRTRGMDPQRLREAVSRDIAAGYVPLLAVATVGTTSTAAVDPLREVGAVCADFGMWLHVDAAYAGAASVCPELRWIHDGIEGADSYSMSPHKWLLTGFDCSVLWLADPAPLLHATSADAAYLAVDSPHAGADAPRDYSNWQLPLGRRFRALKLWSVLRCYGTAGLREHIRDGVRRAERFARLIDADERFEVAAPPQLGLVCFRLTAGNGPTNRLLDAVNTSGQALLSQTRLDGQTALRLAPGGVFTTDAHLDALWDLLRSQADRVAVSSWHHGSGAK